MEKYITDKFIECGFDPNVNVIKKVLDLRPLKYLNHGIQTMCFIQEGYMNVIKCCEVDKSCIKNTPPFKDALDLLTPLRHFILPINKSKLITVDNDLIIYIQPFCKVIDKKTVTSTFIYTCLQLLECMIDSNVKIADVYYKNFGIYHNKCVIYDYHNIESFYTPNAPNAPNAPDAPHSCNFLVVNLYCNITIFANGWTFKKPHSEWNPKDITIATTQEVINDNFGDGRFPPSFSNLLKCLYVCSFDKAKVHIHECMSYISTKLSLSVPSSMFKFMPDNTIITKQKSLATILTQIFDALEPINIRSNNYHVCTYLAKLYPIKSIFCDAFIYDQHLLDLFITNLWTTLDADKKKINSDLYIHIGFPSSVSVVSHKTTENYILLLSDMHISEVYLKLDKRLNPSRMYMCDKYIIVVGNLNKNLN